MEHRRLNFLLLTVAQIIITSFMIFKRSGIDRLTCHDKSCDYYFRDDNLLHLIRKVHMTYKSQVM